MSAHTSKYVYEGTELRAAILKRKKSQQRLALITNSLPGTLFSHSLSLSLFLCLSIFPLSLSLLFSHLLSLSEYTFLLLGYIFGMHQNLSEIFDFIFFAAKKPHFWSNSSQPCYGTIYLSSSLFVCPVSVVEVSSLSICVLCLCVCVSQCLCLLSLLVFVSLCSLTRLQVPLSPRYLSNPLRRGHVRPKDKEHRSFPQLPLGNPTRQNVTPKKSPSSSHLDD